MAKMTQGDFKFLKGKIHSDKDYHEEQFLQRVNPDIIDAYYEGDPEETWKHKENNVRLSINKIFPATSTLLPQLYPSNPKFVPIVKPGYNELDALITTNRMNYHYEQMNALRENQMAILSAWLYGFGVTKQGWRTVFKKSTPVKIEPTDKETKGVISKFKSALGFDNRPQQVEEEEDSEYIAEDSPFLNYVNCKNIFFDKDQFSGRGKFITQMIPKTLADIRNDGIYVVEDDFYNRFNRGKDEREVNVTLYEQWSWTKNGMYVFVMCDGYDKPLRYDKINNASEGFPFTILRFNLQPNRVYETSHMRVAQQAQRAVDYVLKLQKEKIEKWKDITIFNGDALDGDSKAKLIKNVVDANIFTKSGYPASSVASGVTSNPIPKDMFSFQALLEDNIREILTVSGARAGTPEGDTLGQEQIVDYGNQLRSMGLQGRVREFMISQGKRLKQDMMQFDTETSVYVRGINKSVEGSIKITDEIVDLNGRSVKDIVPKDLDLGIDVTEFARRDMAVVRKQLNEVLMTVTNPMIQQSLAMEGKKVSVSELVKDILNTFDALGNAGKYIEDIQTNPTLTAPVYNTSMPPLSPESNPTPESIEQGANAVNVPNMGGM